MSDSNYFWKQLSKSKPQPRLNEVYDFVKIKQVFNEIKSFCLEEELDIVAEKTNLNTMVGKQLETALPGFIFKNMKQGALRMQPRDQGNVPPITDDIVKTAITKLGYEYVNKHAPGGIPGTGSKSKSGKFDTYELNALGAPVFVVFGTGGNKGVEYENKANEEMANLKGEHPVLKLLLPLIAPDTIASVEPRSGSTRRSFTYTIDNVGSVIGDTVVKGTSGKIYYVSLKNAQGATISNHGCAGIFTSWDNAGELKFNPGAVPPITQMFEAVGVDVNVFLNNLKQYINWAIGKEWEPVPDKRVEITQNLEALQTAILSSIGYGYYYAREKGPDKIQFEDFSTPQGVKNFVGDVTKGELRYPYITGESKRQKRKGLDIIAYTDKGWRFLFQLRNASRGLVPRQMNLMIAGNGTELPPEQE